MQYVTLQEVTLNHNHKTHSLLLQGLLVDDHLTNDSKWLVHQKTKLGPSGNRSRLMQLRLKGLPPLLLPLGQRKYHYFVNKISLRPFLGLDYTFTIHAFMSFERGFIDNILDTVPVEITQNDIWNDLTSTGALSEARTTLPESSSQPLLAKTANSRNLALASLKTAVFNV